MMLPADTVLEEKIHARVLYLAIFKGFFYLQAGMIIVLNKSAITMP